MAQKKAEIKREAELPVKDYQHRGARRKNIPPAGLAAQGK